MVEHTQTIFRQFADKVKRLSNEDTSEWFQFFLWNLYLLFKKQFCLLQAVISVIIFIDVFVNADAVRHRFVAW